MPGLIREARDMQGIRKEAAPKKEGEAALASARAAAARSSRPRKKS